MTVVLSVAAIPFGSGSLPIADADQNPFRVVIWGGAFIACLVVLFLAVSAIRRWLKHDDEPTPLGFTLGDLRTLHRQGKMTDEEYDRAKTLMIGQAKRDAERSLAAKSQKVKDDLGVRTNSAEDLALFARALRDKAAREEASGNPPASPPPAPAGEGE